MNILFLNNYHYLRGGSERVFFGDMQLLEQHGHKAIAFARKHTEHIPSEYEDYFPKDIKTDSIHFSWGALRTLKEIFYSSEAKRALYNILKEFSPDIAHAHNIYGRLTSSVLDLLTKMDIPILMTLHDYKLICPNYKMLNNGQICEACKGTNFYMALKNKCHKNSFLASMVYMMESYFCLWLGKYTSNVSIFVAPSLFIKNKYIQFGWTEDRIEYLPNFITLSKFDPDFAPGNYFLYLGRLSSEKGILTLINSFMMLDRSDARLMIAGEGPLRSHLKERASKDTRIRFTGHLSGNTLKETTRKALAVIVPSEWYENAPLSILESFAYGKLVVGSRIGGITEMIEDGVNGYLFEPGNVNDLRGKLELMLSLPDTQIREMGEAARQKVEREYNSELHYERLMNIYHRALSKT
jgi:glycosyltransferase involved in cell wall biosynthesis